MAQRGAFRLTHDLPADDACASDGAFDDGNVVSKLRLEDRIEVLAAALRAKGVRVGQAGEDADLIAILELEAGRPCKGRWERSVGGLHCTHRVAIIQDRSGLLSIEGASTSAILLVFVRPVRGKNRLFRLEPLL